MELSVALKQAQAMGYAEADPTNDIEGIDVFYKTNITNMLAYNTKNDTIRQPIGITETQILKILRWPRKMIKSFVIFLYPNRKMESSQALLPPPF